MPSASPGAVGVTPGQLAVGLRVGFHPLPGSAADLPEDPRRDSGGEHPAGDHHARRHGGARGDQCARADDRAVKHGGTVAHQGFGADDRAVNHAQVAYGRPLPHLGGRIGAPVQHRPVLNVRPPPDHDRPEVGAQHGPIPDGRRRLDSHITDQGGRGRDPCFGANDRFPAFEGKQRHPPMMHD